MNVYGVVFYFSFVLINCLLIVITKYRSLLSLLLMWLLLIFL